VARSAPDPRRYEMMIVVAPTVGDEGLITVIERVSGYVAAHDGEVESTNHENPWGRRRLAYPIKKFQDAYYVLYYFVAPPESITPIERDLRIDEQVIRHLIVKYDPMTEPGPTRRSLQAEEEQAQAKAAETPTTTEVAAAPAEEDVVVVEEVVAEPVGVAPAEGSES